MAPPVFDTTPEKEASIANFLYRQMTYKPQPVTSPSLSGQTAIVTGSNTGIGLEIARQLLDLNITTLILAVRSPSKGAAAVTSLAAGRSLPPSTIQVWPLDLDSYPSITAFAERTKSLPRIDIVINNAGIINATQLFSPSTGHDQMIQVNYLSQALLTLLLLPIIKSKHLPNHPTRITFTSSDAAAWTSFPQRNHNPLLPSLSLPTTNVDNQYFTSKLLGMLFVSELAKHVPPKLAVVNLATPGMCVSELNRAREGTFVGRVVRGLQGVVAYSAAAGAMLVVDAAVGQGGETHGCYLGMGERRVRP